jgi:hypothetical protein
VTETFTCDICWAEVHNLNMPMHRMWHWKMDEHTHKETE